MLMRRFLPWALALLLVATFGYGLLHLFALRFAQGDVYPSYSSLRADPLGTKALFDALGRMQSLETTRNFRPLQQLKPAEPVTLFYLGVSSDAIWDRAELRHFETLVGSGSRAVFAFAPKGPVAPMKKEPAKKETEPAKAEEKQAEEKKAEEPAKEAEKQEAEKENEKSPVEPEVASLLAFDQVAERWGVRIALVTRVVSKGGKTAKPQDPPHNEHAAATLADSESALEGDLPYRSAIYFTDLQPAWRVLYRVADQPVLIERPWGDGTLVLAGDSFFLSNEALRDEPRPKLLAWLADAHRTVVFDEEHHGIREETGIAALAQKYRLQGALVALLVVAALVIWRSSVPFVRVAQEEDDDERVEGRDAAEAFSSLLRRSIAPSRILEACIAEWRKSFSRSPREAAAIEAVLAEENARPARERSPVAAYRRISEALRRTPHSPKAT